MMMERIFMNKEMKSVLKKTAKIAGVTGVAAGAVAIMTSGAALKALSEGGYLVNTVKKIMNEQEAPEESLEDAAVSEADLSKEASAGEPHAEEVTVAEEI